MLYLLTFISIVILIFTVRNELVYKCRMKAIRIINEQHLDFDLLYIDDYNAQVLDLTKWTFKQFFPMLRQS